MLRGLSARSPKRAVPIGVVLSLLYVGIVRIALLPAMFQSEISPEGAAGYLESLWLQPTPFGVSLGHLLFTIDGLLLAFLWLEFRSRGVTGVGVGSVVVRAIYLSAAALLLYLGYALWAARQFRMTG